MLRSTAVPPGNKPIDPRGDPKYYGYTWTNWMDFYDQTPPNPGKGWKLRPNFNDEFILRSIGDQKTILNIWVLCFGIILNVNVSVVPPNAMFTQRCVKVAESFCQFDILPNTLKEIRGGLAWFRQMRGNRMLVSGTRWQHGSQICFTTFIKWKLAHKMVENSTTPIAREKISTDLGSLEF